MLPCCCIYAMQETCNQRGEHMFGKGSCRLSRGVGHDGRKSAKNSRFSCFLKRTTHTGVIWANHGQNYCLPTVVFLCPNIDKKRLNLDKDQLRNFAGHLSIHLSVSNCIQKHAFTDNQFVCSFLITILLQYMNMFLFGKNW